MFKKKPTIKTLSPLRSSDRRKIADEIISDLNLQAQPDPQLDDQKLAATQALTALRNRLLSDNCLSATFTTTRGPDLVETRGTIYVGSHDGAEQRVLWFRVDGRLVPSVYTLWHNPQLLSLVQTPGLVIEKIRGGADLMAPGVGPISGLSEPAQDSLVAISSLDAPTVPLAVGVCVSDLKKLRSGQQAKGKAVDVLHFCRDHLWDWSTSGKSGRDSPEDIPAWIPSSMKDVSNGIATASLEDNDPEGGVLLTPSEPSRHCQEELASADEGAQVTSNLSAAETDEVFKQAFLYGIYDHRNRNEGPKYGLNFPLTQSVFISTLVLPYLPTHNAQLVEALSMKKTSWKSARKFIKALHKQKLLLGKDHQNEMLVLDVDFNDAQFKNFRPYPLPKKETASANTATASEKQANDPSVDAAVGQKLKVIQVHKPKHALMPLFKDLDDRATYLPSEIRSSITDYVESEKLIDANNKQLVRLDPFLANQVFNESNPLNNQILAKGAAQREQLVQRVTSLCAPYHLILRNEEIEGVAKSPGKPKAGAAPRIEIILETRSGNKTVTRVHGFEPYHIQPQPLADELRKACAGSTSVEPFRAGKGIEVMIQGPQRDSVVKALEKRGIAKGWIDTLDKTKKK